MFSFPKKEQRQTSQKRQPGKTRLQRVSKAIGIGKADIAIGGLTAKGPSLGLGLSCNKKVCVTAEYALGDLPEPTLLGLPTR